MVEYHPDDIVVIRASEDWPEHLFRITEVFDDCVGGYSLNGPLEGEYGEPDFDLILRVYEGD
ncbi:hypothetical protein K3723_13435 [Leisingera caerulea]|uniref:hypothetical protein n=1 Tax=Leisingera caerulea TaxID=506591 RepID=UPI0021A2EC28|nr:hypothetical protein [Leisingera caerulea]UWQ61854.1 hypothetical protein K3723_13435 [Leisingera caerulea]